jgi:quercetin dioxygenase-like cupin family protein
MRGIHRLFFSSPSHHLSNLSSPVVHRRLRNVYFFENTGIYGTIRLTPMTSQENFMKTIFSMLICITLFLGTSLRIVSAQPRPPQGSASDTTKYTIGNCINSFSMDRIEKTRAGYQYWFADKDLAGGKTLKMSVVVPHSATHPPHIHPEDEFFFVLEGTAEFYLKGTWTAAGPYTSFYCPSNVEHGIRNAGDTILKYLVLKKYEN